MSSLLLASVLALFSHEVAPSGKARCSTGHHEQGDALELAGIRLTRIEQQANTFTSSTQDGACLDADGAGRILLVWQSRRQEEGTYGIYGQRFAADGERLGGELHLNASTSGMQMDPCVAVESDGSAWVAWMSFNPGGHDPDQGAIVARRLDLAGAPTREIAVNDLTAGHQCEPNVAALPGGGCVVVWKSSTEQEQQVRARLIGSDGTPSGPSFLVSSSGVSHDGLPCVASDARGNFAVAWARTDVRGVPTGILVRRFQPDGAPFGGEVQVSPQDGRHHVEPVIASNTRGEIAVAWLVSGSADYSVLVRRFVASESSLEALDVESIETGTPPYTSGIDIALRDDGRWLLAWNSFGDGEGKADLHARLFDRDGQPLSPRFEPTAARAGHQKVQQARGTRRVLYRPGLGLAFAWTGDAGRGDDTAANLTLLRESATDAAGERGCSPALGDDGEAGGNLVVLAHKQAPVPHDPPTFNPRDIAPPEPPRVSPEGLGFGFDGVLSTGWTPPDPHMAVGPGHIVLMTNGAIAFYQKNGTFNFQDEIEGSFGFWGSLGTGGFVFDPEVIFDPHTNRFMAMACERTGGQSFFVFAVSDDSDPNGTWFKYRFNVTAISANNIDSPNMAVNQDAVFLTADFFGPDRYLIFMIEKAAVLIGAAPTTTNLLITGQQSIGIPVTYGTPPAQYMIEAFESGINTAVRFHAITDPLGTPVRQTFDLTIPSYAQPEDPPQMGTTVRPECFESRFWSCVYRNGSLWATHHVNSTRVRQRWYEFDMQNWPISGTPTLIQTGEVDPGGTVRTFFGSIWVDSQNNAAIVCARSSPTEFISMGVATRRASDPLGMTTPLQTLISSTSPETSGRWGDYSGTSSDPIDLGVFWGHHEYFTSTWRTRVERIEVCPEPEAYCTGKTTSQGCVPFMSFSGVANATSGPFQVITDNLLEGETGIFLYGFNKSSLSFHGGTLCVKAPFTRLTSLIKFTDGEPCFGCAQPTCRNASRNFNQLIQGGTDPMLTVGQRVNVQFRQRDTNDPTGFGDNLSDGLSFVICP